jgi:tetratricopeptide (TPR) repeat protein
MIKETMRRFALVLTIALPGVALADMAAPSYAQPRGPEIEYWEAVVTPQAGRIARLRADGLQLKQRAQQIYEPQMTAERMKFFGQALEKFEAAAALAPDRAEVVRDYAEAAFDAAEYEKAVNAYLRFRELAPDDRNALIERNMASAYLKLLRFEDAAAALEHSLGDDMVQGYERNTTLGLLGYTYMAQGRIEDAIDAYTRATLATNSQRGYGYGYGYGPDQITLTGLAVAYDRDEQVGRSQELLEQVRQLDPLFTFIVPQPYQMGSQIPFSPPSDKHYWLALCYEAKKDWSAAAVEWRAYIDSAEPTYKRRAEEHLKLANAELDKKLKATRAAQDKAAKKAKDKKTNK